MIFKKALFKIGFRYFYRHPLQSIMMIVGIAIGVALVVSIDIANSSVEASFKQSTVNITGRATHQITPSYGYLDQSVFTDLKIHLGFEKSAPVIVAKSMVKEFDNRLMRILALDPFSEFNFRNIPTPESRQNKKNTPENQVNMNLGDLIFQENSAMISKNLADEYNLKVGDTLTLLLGNKESKLQIIDLIVLNKKENKSIGDGFIFMDVSTAQEILNLTGKLSYIDLILNNQKELSEIKKILPENVRIVPTAQKSAAIREMSKSFEFNLAAFSLLALLVGLFLIYNTVTFSVIRRRHQFGVLRALGVTRRGIFRMIVFETLLLGLLGTILGLLLGVVFGIYTVRMVSQTVSTLYFLLSDQVFHVSAFTLIKGFLLGTLVSVLSSIVPAFEAVQSQTNETLQQSSLETKTNRLLPYISSFGILLNLIGYFIIKISGKNIPLGFLGTACVVFGFAFFIPAVVRGAISIFIGCCSSILGVITKIALRNISRSLSRTGVSIAALMIAISVYIGVGIMIGSFKASLNQWVDHHLQGDVHISLADETDYYIDELYIQKIENISVVEKSNQYQFIKIETGPYINSTLFVSNIENPDYQWIWHDEKDTRKSATLPDVFVSESFAWKHDITQGKNRIIPLITLKGEVKFRVIGVFSDFFLRGGRIVINQNVYQKYWNEKRITNIEVFLKKQTDINRFFEEVKSVLPVNKFQFVPQVQIRKRILKAFDNTFAITVALQVLSALVAVIGILNTIMSLIHDRFREIGVLRANGLSIRQLWKMLIIESGAIGLFSGLLALPLGSVMSWILIVVINKRSFGWTLSFQIDWHIYTNALILSLTAALVAGIIPAWKASRTGVIEAIRTE